MARKQLETLTEQMYYLLLALHQPVHGYAVMQFVANLTEGRVQIGAGTLYTLLSRFEADGYITRIGTETNAIRKEYVLTEEGRRLFKKERTRLQLLLRDSEQSLAQENAEGRLIP